MFLKTEKNCVTSEERKLPILRIKYSPACSQGGGLSCGMSLKL